MTRTRSIAVVLAAVSYSVLAVCSPSSAKNIFGSTSPTPKSPSKAPDPSTISSQVQFKRSYTGPGPRMASSDASWSPPACWYEPAYSPAQMEHYLETNYMAEHIAKEVIGEDLDPGGIDYHTGQKGTWWKLVIPDIGRSGECTAQHSWLWIKPAAPVTGKVPLIDPKTLAGLAYNDTTLPAPPVTLRPAAENQLVNLDTELKFTLPLHRVWTTASLNNPAAGVNVAATTVATPAQLRVDAGTDYADPRSCTYQLTPHGATYTVDTSSASCNVTYRKAGGYPLTASLVWKVTWTPSADPAGPPSAAPVLPDGQSASQNQVTVRENEAVNR